MRLLDVTDRPTIDAPTRRTRPTDPVARTAALDGVAGRTSRPVGPPVLTEVLVVEGPATPRSGLKAALERDLDTDGPIHLVLPARPVVHELRAVVDSEHLPLRPGEPPDLALTRLRLADTLDWLGSIGVLATGEVGDPDPVRAVREALPRVNTVEVLVTGGSGHRGRWRTDVLARRLEHALRLPVRRPTWPHAV
jgi:hypothetical protein